MTTANSNDADLVAETLAGNRDAFAQIVGQYQSLICSLAYSATGSLSQSEDLAQEVFLKAWRELARLNEPAKLRSWLCGIARNTIVDALRRVHREPVQRAEALDTVADLAASETPVEEHVIQREEEAILWRSLEQMPENYREPLILFYREGQSVERVAQELDLSEDAVKQRLSRGRKLLSDEVTGFVERTLKRSNPGRAFTIGVLAALPIVAETAKAAAVSATVLKGTTGSTISQAGWNTLVMTTKTKILLVTVLAVAAVSTPILIQKRTIAKLRAERQSMVQESTQVLNENQRLSNALAQANSDKRMSRAQTRELARLRSQAGQVDDAKKKLAARLEAAAKEGKGLDKIMSEVMDNPAAKNFIREQQRAMIVQLYAPFLKQAGLPAEQAEKFQEMMLDRQMQAMDKARFMFNGDVKERAAASKAMEADQKAFDDQLKGLLGEDHFQQFKTFEQSAYDRLQLTQFKDRLHEKPTDQQIEQLLAITTEEKKHGAESGVLAGDPQKLKDLPPGEQFEKVMDGQRLVNERIYARAANVLSPEQLQSFGTFQTNQLEAGRMAMKMAQKMFGSSKSK